MIDGISIADIATFGVQPEKLDGLSQFNYLFGSNGTGKTTISRVIADEESFPTCKIKWKGGTKLQPMVYNHDFVERNFNQSAELKGVFTLGEKQVDTLAKIDAATKVLDALTSKIEGLNQTLHGANGTGGKMAELNELESAIKEKCWAQKQKHDDKLQGAFEGYRGSSEKFKSKVIQELSSNTATLLTLTELEKKAESVFGQAPTTEQMISDIDTKKLLSHESNPILKKRVIGKEDVDIAAMIKKLGNSDWVREGRPFYEVNEGVCPFCQQSTDEIFAQGLNDYFDETFETDSKAIDYLATNYETDAARLQQQIASIIEAPSRFLDVEKLKAKKELLDSKITINIQRLAGKKKEASRVVELESVSNVIETISSLIASANDHISEHNDMVANISKERTTLTAQVWKYVLEELKVDLTSYQTKRNSLNKAIESLNKQIKTATEEKQRKEFDILELEKQTTSVQPTIDGINSILSSFGFQGFSIEKVASCNSYKLVRTDGSDAHATLSEGEKTFVTFLYFYFRSRVVELESVSKVIETISSLIASANDHISEHNDMVANISKERTTLTAQVWKYVLEELKVDLTSYQTKRNSLNKAIESLNKQIKTATEEKQRKEFDILELEKQTTSVQPTIDGINSILSSFGFQGFSIEKVASCNSYKLVRTDGSDAHATLSEGEKTFVTFLYFYHLLKGSDSESGISNDRVVVFDDPVSSLDSDILFIVSSLIKGIFDEVRAGAGHIKQVFVLTHNVYFHKEVTFNPKRGDVAMNEEAFWIVRKPAHVTKIEKYPSNPIKSSYELLWSEVRNPDRSNLTIQNTLRRILENYFNILGGVNPDEITSMFVGKEKMICKSLFSWVNDGSHFAHDDLYVTIDSSIVESYLNVFRAIFNKAGHFAHYQMMMGDAPVESVNE